MCKGSKSTTTQTNTALPQYSAAYSSLLPQIQQTASQPYQQYPGNLVQPFSDLQNEAFGAIQNTAGASGDAAAQPYFDTAQQFMQTAASPLWPSVQQFSPGAVEQYESPYTSDVVNSTENQFNLQNAQQQAQLTGSVAANGALGGDRQAVLQSELAGQQQTSEAPVIANLENQGYQTALGEFNTQQQNQLGANEANAWLNSQAGFGEANLGLDAQNAQFAGAGQELQAGGLEQELGQENLNVPYEQFLAQEAYPFQTQEWEAALESGLGGAAGSTSTATTEQQQSLLSSILGAASIGAGIYGETGGFGGSTMDTGSLTSLPTNSELSGYGINPYPNIVPTATFGQNPYYKRGGLVQRRDVGGPLGPQVPFGANVPNLDVSIIPQAQMPQGGPPKANASAAAPKGGGSGSGGINIGQIASLASFAAGLKRGGGISNVIPFPQHRARGGRGIAGYADGGAPDNDNAPDITYIGDTPMPATGQMQATGTDELGPMPFPHLDYHPQAIPDNSAEEMRNAPWEALIAGGANMLATGNVGQGIAAGLKNYQGARAASQAETAKRVEAQNEGSYKQADVEEGANKLWQTAKDAQARQKQEAQNEADTQAYRAQTNAREISAETAREQEAKDRLGVERAQLDQGRYQMQPGMGTDPVTGQQVSGSYIFNTRTGKSEFQPGTDLTSKSGSGGLGGREGVFFGRITQAGNAATAAAQNIMELPITTSRGLFGGRSQGPGLMDAVKEDLANTVTSSQAQEYNTMMAGVSRNLSAIESAGLAPNGSLTHSMDSLVIKDGDTQNTIMRKMAEMRQIVETGLEPSLSNPRIPKEQKALVQGIIDKMQKAIPFTQHDITQLETSKDPQATIGSVAKARGLGGGPVVPPMPSNLPDGSKYSPSRKQWRDLHGRIYDASGQPVQ